MKTQRRILLVVGVLVLAFAGLVVLAGFLLGAVLGSVVVAGAVVIMTGAYFGLVRRWLLRWGATASEVARPMPGDGILGADARCTTRGITIGVPATQVPIHAYLGRERHQVPDVSDAAISCLMRVLRPSRGCPLGRSPDPSSGAGGIAGCSQAVVLGVDDERGDGWLGGQRTAKRFAAWRCYLSCSACCLARVSQCRMM